MNKIAVSTDKAPKAIGPYSQAVRIGDLLFLSGQIPLDPDSGQMAAADIKVQTRRVLDNMRAILQSQGLAMENVAKTTVYLADFNHFAAMNEIYSEYFVENPPARSTVQVSRLPKDSLVEIEAIAIFP